MKFSPDLAGGFCTDKFEETSRAEFHFEDIYHARTRRTPTPTTKLQELAGNAAGLRERQGERVLDVGCGPYKVLGAVGIDHTAWPGVDVEYDLDCYPWPFANSVFDRAICRHSLAHLENVVKAIEELHRILRPKGVLEIVCPHFSSDNAFTDITSRWFFGYRSMDFFCPDRKFKYRYGSAKFELAQVRISFLQAAVFPPDRHKPNPFRAVGIEALVNRFPRFYEHFLAFLLRANEVYYRLYVVK